MKNTILSMLTALLALGCEADPDELRASELSVITVEPLADGAAWVHVDGELAAEVIAIDECFEYRPSSAGLLMLDGETVRPGIVCDGGDIDIGPGSDSLRCACIDDNGVGWTQDCGSIPCAKCCPDNGGRPARFLKISPSMCTPSPCQGP